VDEIGDPKQFGYQENVDGIVLAATQDESIYAPAPGIVYMTHQAQ